MALNPRTGLPRELPGRAARLLLAVWWIFAPAILGYMGTFPARQSIVLGLVLVPILAIGLFIPQLGWFLLAGGLWMIGSAFVSGSYLGLEQAWWHDVITGMLGVVLGAVPFWVLAERRAEKPVEATPERPSLFAKGQAAKPAPRSLFRAKRRMSLTGPVVETVHIAPTDRRAEGEPDKRAVREMDTTLGREIPIGPRPNPTDPHPEP